METLNLPYYSFRLRQSDSKKEIFDRVRKKFVALTPEEWVRQNFVSYLIEEKHFPSSLIKLEPPVKLNRLNKRPDILVYSRNLNELLVVECKSHKVPISQMVFDQVFSYNMALKVKYMVVTNGLNHYCCYLDENKQSIVFLENIPDYSEL